jgi:hypothetical protein
LRSPHCLRANRAFAIAIVTRGRDTVGGSVSREGRVETQAEASRAPSTPVISHSSANSCAERGPQ